MIFNLFQYSFWLLAVVVQITASFSMFKRNLHHRFPAFFAYLLLQAFRSVVLLAIVQLGRGAGVYRIYFVFYWSTEAICAALSLFVIYDVSQKFFRHYQLARMIVSTSLILGLLALLAFNVFLTARTPTHEPHPLLSAILLLSRSVAVIETGLLLLFFAFARVLALTSPRELPFGIGLGLGVLGAVEVAAFSLRAHFGSAANAVCSVSDKVACFLAVLIWLVYIVVPRQAGNVSLDVAPTSTHVQHWNDALTEFLQR